jgi:putative ABC transport system permease protein
MNASLYFKYMTRESRGSGGRLAFFVACLAVGVAAVVTVAGLSSSMDEGIRAKARDLLAADLVVEGGRPIPEKLNEALRLLPGAKRADLREMVTIVAAADGPSAGSSRLAQLKVVDGEYPFYGDLVTEPDRPLDRLLDEGSVVVASDLLSSLGLGRGGRLRVGGVEFTVTAVLFKEPDRLDINLAALAPRVFLAPEGLARTGLEGWGSRILYKALVKMPEGSDAGEVRAAAVTIREALPEAAFLRIETYAEAQPALRASLRRADRFLGLVALLSLLIGGIGVAQTVRAWLAGRMDAIAVLKCLGVRPREILGLYLGQTALLGLAGSVMGVLAGMIGQWITPWFLEGVFPVELIRPWQPMAMLRGLLMGVGVALLFSLPPLMATRRVPPVRVFRRDAEPISAGRWVRLATGALLLGGILATAVIQARSWPLAIWFTLGSVALVTVLALAALLITRAVSRLPRDLTRVWVRHGLGALARPGAATLGAIVALGLGVAVVLGMHLVENRLSGRLEMDLPDEAPSVFMMDIQPDQWGGVRQVLEDQGATRIDSVPVVIARLLSVDGVPVEDLAKEEPENQRRRWILTREQRLTYMRELPEKNEIVEGALWSDPDRAEVSVEEEFARQLGARIGSVLQVDIQGAPLELVVTSLRAVVWETFRINFFLLVEPGVLETAPQLRLAAAQLPVGTEQQVQDLLVGSFPNVTLIRIREVLEKIAGVLRQAGLGVRVLGGFTVVAGILILGGAVSAASVRRGREVALLKTLGMTRRGVIGVYSVEYALIGLVAGVIGVCGGGVLASTILTQWMEIPWEFTPGPFVLAVAGTILLSIAAGAAASARSLSRRPVEVLRDE